MNKVKSTLLPIYIVKKDSTGKELNKRKINFQVNYGHVYRISYKYFTPEGYRVSKDSKRKPIFNCKYGKNGLNVKSITFSYVKKDTDTNVKSPTHQSSPIYVNYIDVDSNRKIQTGLVTGKYNQVINVLDQVTVPSGYRVCKDQKTSFRINNHNQSIDLMVKHQDNEESIVDSDNNDDDNRVTVKSNKDDPSVLHGNLKENVQTLENNLQKYDCNIAVQLIHTILNHDLNSFKKVIMAIFTKMKYRGVNNLEINPQERKISGVIKKRLDNNNHVNFTFVRARKYDVKHQVTISEVRDFVTSVTDHNSSKGVFITTSSFDDDACKEAKRHSIILIDGMKLAQLMIQNDIGVTPKRIFKIVSLNKEFF